MRSIVTCMTSDHKSIINNRSLNAFCCSSFHDLATTTTTHTSIHLSIQALAVWSSYAFSVSFTDLFSTFACQIGPLSILMIVFNHRLRQNEPYYKIVILSKLRRLLRSWNDKCIVTKLLHSHGPFDSPR